MLSLLGALPVLQALEPGIASPADARPDRIIIRAKSGAASEALAKVHARLGTKALNVARHRGEAPDVVSLPPGLSVGRALETFRASGAVDYAEPDYLLKLLATPNDTRYLNLDQWNLNNTGIYGGVPGADVSAEAGWDLQTDASNIIVAVVDTGVRYTHEDLAANMWINAGESGVDALGRNKRTNGVDDDGNGYIDDVHGINVLNGSGNPTDDWGHGTHVAGIVGAVGNNALGVTGVAWRVKLMAIKFIDASANYSVSDAITALNYARAHGARIVTASWGNYAFTSQALRDAITALRNAGIIVTAAAGNDNNNNDTFPLYPASYEFDNILAVAATNRVDGRAGYSNYGATTVDLGAPGSPVFSTWGAADNAYQYYEGTSMAAPHLAGACALLWARFPSDTYQQIIARVLSTVDPLPSLNGRAKSNGRLNLGAALASGSAPPPPPPPPLAAPGAMALGSVTLTWTDNTTTETGFEIERSTDNATFAQVAVVAANTTSATFNALNAGVTYYFRVRAVQGSNASPYSPVISLRAN